MAVESGVPVQAAKSTGKPTASRATPAGPTARAATAAGAPIGRDAKRTAVNVHQIEGLPGSVGHLDLKQLFCARLEADPDLNRSARRPILPIATVTAVTAIGSVASGPRCADESSGWIDGTWTAICA